MAPAYIPVYEQLVSAQCETDSHESDLYVIFTPESYEIVKASGWYFTRFLDQAGAQWIEVPFAFAPWWQARQVAP